MRRPIRRLVLLGILFAVSIAVIAIPRVEVDTPVLSFDRGDSDNFLGLSLGLDLKGGSHLVYKAAREDGSPPTREDLDGVRKVLEKRVSSFGLSEPTIQLLGQPPDRVLVQLPGLSGATISVRFDGDVVRPEELEAFLRSPAVGHPEATVVEGDDGLVASLDELAPAVRDADGNVITEAEGDKIRRMIEDEFPVTILLSFAAVDPVTGEPVAPTAPNIPAAPAGGHAGATAPAPAGGHGQPAPTPEAAGGDPGGVTGSAGDTGGTGTPVPAPADGEPATGDTPDAALQPVIPDISIAQIQAALAGIGQPDAVVTEVGANTWSIEVTGDRTDEVDADGNRLPTLVDNVRTAIEDLGPIARFGAVGAISQYVVGGGVQEAKRLIGQTAQLEFRERTCGSLAPPTPDTVWPPDGLSPNDWLAARCSDPQYYTEQKIDIAGSDLTDAFAGTQPGVLGPVVNIRFNGHGSSVFCDVTGRISRPTRQDVVAIYLDGEQLVAPSAQTAICNGQAFIFGNFTAERARTISIQLRSGALPVQLELIQERNVDATLGADSLRKSVIAGAVGLFLVLTFMVLYYKVPGVVASITLIMYTALLLAVFKLIPVTLTLSGVAAIILSIGLAVDANILIAERTKEELRMGRALLASITAGFDRAWPSIRDGNLSTIITSLVLFWFGDRLGTSLIQGFALTLAIGVVLSMFTAFFASRVIMRSIAGTAFGRRPSSYVPVGTVGTERAVGEAE